MTAFILKELPPDVELETKAILKQATQSHRYLAELKGIARSIPNQGILISTLPLLEAKDSSAIENIITTHDELYQGELFADFVRSSATKEVQNYALALRSGFDKVVETKLLTNNIIIEIQAILESHHAGFRKTLGVTLKNDRTGETVYTPPQHPDDVLRLMSNLEKTMNDPDFIELDDLVKMAVIHYQFESIHPFGDGNGRTGRIINILFLVLRDLLELPVLYLSRYIIRNKDRYYERLQAVRDKGDWEGWILYMLVGVEETAKDTIGVIQGIKKLMSQYKQHIRTQFNNMYSQDLLNNLFKHPYTKIEFLENDLQISRQTAAKYLDTLAEANLLRKQKIGRNNFYINDPLYDLFLKA